MNYPLISEYIEAIKSAEDNFKEWTNLRPVLGDDGEPVMSVGGFSVVFKMKDERDGKNYAVKCFTKEQEKRAESYRLIADELEYVSSNYLTPISYLEKELFVDTTQTDETEFPVLLMDWVEGKTLDVYIKENSIEKYILEMLTFQFCKMASWLLSQPFSHGDLKPDNILVKEDGRIVLVDYDGMFVPAMKGQKAKEMGSPNFRHPMRSEDVFNEHIDDFPVALIALSLKAFSIKNELINEFCSSDMFLFKENDFASLNNSRVTPVLLELLSDHELCSLYGIFLIALANNSLFHVSSKLFSLGNPKNSLSYGDYLYNKARGFCEAEDNKDIDYKKAFNYFYKAAQINHSNAQCCLGCCYRNGHGVKIDYEKAMKWYKISSQNGCGRALRHIAMCYEDGTGVSKNIYEAIKYYQKAIEHNDILSMVIMGKIYYYGRGGIPIDYNKAAEWYLKSAEKGNTSGMWRLADCYKMGKGVERNLRMSFEWYKQSADKGSSEGQWKLGTCYFNGEGIEKNYQIAVEWFEKAASSGDCDGLWRLGHCYQNGLGIEKNADMAFVLFKKAAEKGSSEGQWRLAQCYRYGQGVLKNIKEALCWYMKAADQGMAKAMDAYKLLNNDPSELYKDACSKIDNNKHKEAYDIFYSIALSPYGQNGLGVCFAKGYYVEKNYNTAAYWFLKAARQGFPVAQFNIGNCYYEGKGVRMDKSLAEYWHKKSAEQGYEPAKVIESWKRSPAWELIKESGINKQLSINL